MKCAKCGLMMKITGSRVVTSELNKDSPEGETAGNLVAQEPGDVGKGAVLETLYECSNCGGIIVKKSR